MRPPLKFLLPVLVAGVLFGAWHFASASLAAKDQAFLLPGPREVWDSFHEVRPQLMRAAWNTGQGALLGFGSAIVLSLAAAIVMSYSTIVRATIFPYLMILQMTPVIVFAPMLVLWADPGLKSVSIITFLICFFPLVTNTTQGLISTDRSHVELFRMYRANRRQELWRLRLPGALPYFFTGLRIAAVLAPIGAVVGDYTAGSSAGDGGGLGFQTIIYSSQSQTGALFATAAVTCVLGFIFVSIVTWLSWLCLHRWHDSYERSDQ